jgi:HPr kinase/phosphorylase
VLGRSGSGKSGLVQNLLLAGGRLVADDRVRLNRSAGRLIASAVALEGHLELRGQGIYRLAYQPSTVVNLAVRLAAAEVRLPPVEVEKVLDVHVPLIRIAGDDPTAVARIALALIAERVEPAGA